MARLTSRETKSKRLSRLASLLSGIIVEDDSNPQVIRGELEARQIGGTKHLTGQR